MFSKDLNSEQVNIIIQGSGLTAHICAALFNHLGIKCDLILNDKKRFFSPHLVLNDVCISLLDSIFSGINDNIFAHGIKLTSRYVSWGVEKSLLKVPFDSISIPSKHLLEIIKNHIKGMKYINLIDIENYKKYYIDKKYTFTIDTNIKNNKITKKCIKAGSRKIYSFEVELKNFIISSAVYMESTEDGWLFMAPLTEKKWQLQLMIIPDEIDTIKQAEFLLSQSSFIFPLISSYIFIAEFDAAPYLNYPLFEEGYIAIGEAAAKLDPVSGEGTPFAFRTAILATTIIASIINEKASKNALLSHYNDRIILSFICHLKGCINFYEEAFKFNKSWIKEIYNMKKLVRHLQFRHPKCHDDLEFELIHNTMRLK